MNGIKKVMCCLLISLMLINPRILCIAAAEEAASEKEIEPILQMEPVQQTVPMQSSQNTEKVLEESPTPEDPMEMPSVEGAKKDVPGEGNAASGVEADSNLVAAVASANENEETSITYETPVIDLATVAVSKSVIYARESIRISMSVSNPASVQSLSVTYFLNDTRMDLFLYYNTDTGLFETDFLPDSFGAYEVLFLKLTGQSETQQVFYNGANSSILDGSITLPEDAETYDLSALNITYIDARISTMDELKGAVANAADGETIEILSSEHFVVDESITIPSNVKLLIQPGEGSFTVANGVTLTTAAEFNCHVPMTVNGKWICNAYSICRNGLTITATGTVDSRNGWIDLYGTFTNEGTFVSGSRMQHTHLVSSVAEIRATLETIADGDCIEVNGCGEDLIVDQDLTIPKGIYLSIQSGANSFQIAEGVAFSTASSFNCRVPMTVAGTWQCTGTAYCYNGLHITSTGQVENKDYLQISDEYNNLGTLTTASTATTRLELNAYSLVELKAALMQENPGQMSINLCISDGVTLTEDVTIPENVSLFISGGESLTVGEGVTFTTIGGFDCYAPLTVDGTWKCSGHSYCYGGLSITSTGCVENSSYLYIYDSYDNQGTLIADFNWSTRLILRVSGKQTLKEDMTLSENLSLYIYGQTSDAALTVSEGVSLTTMGEFYCYIPLTVAGTWVNEGGSTCRDGLTITTTGTVDSRNGWIDLYGTFTNEGAFVSGSRMQHTHLVSSVAEIRATLETIADGDCIAVNGHGEDLIVDQDLTIPKGVYLSIQSGANGFKIAEGVAFSTASSFNCYAPMTVAGTWQCTGAAYCYNGLHITSTGRVENRDYLQISDEYSNLGTLTTASTAATRLELNAYSLAELKAALKHENPDQMSIYLCVSGDMVLTEDITIPEGVSLHISEDAQLTVGEGVTFTTIGKYFSCSGSMTVDGTWINSANCYCGDSLTITSSGTLENSGTIEVYGDYIPNGTIIESAGHHIRVNYTVSTMEELLAAIDKVKTADSITIESSDEAFVIDQSVTIPNGVRLSAERAITIGKGVTFTTIGGFDCYAPMTVDGTWKCSGHSYCYGGLSITSTGCVENEGVLWISGECNNQGVLTTSSSATTHLELNAYSLAELKAALMQENLGQMSIYLRISEGMALTEDITIPEDVSLYIYGQTSDAALTVSEGVSLTTMGEFYCYIPLTVAGTWVNEGGSTCNSGLTITPTGIVDNARGWIHLNGALNNEGALTNSSGVYQTNTARSPEELTLAIEHTLTGGTIRVSGDGGDFVINKEMTIPAGITVEVYGDVQNLRIGTNLTIDAGATLRSEAPLVVEGSVYNYGAIGAKNGLHVPGKIHNYDYIRVNGELTGEENIVEYEAGFCSVYQEYSVDSEESLLTVLDSMDMNKWNKIVAADSLTLTKDTTIPAGVYLEIQSGTFRISENATLVTYNNLDIHEDMVVDGYWENRYTNYGGYCGIRGNLTAKNVIKNSGHVELYKYCQALAEGMIDSSEGSQGSVGCGITITSLDELRSITEKENCPRMSIIWNPAEPVILDRDLTIPDGLRLYIEGESSLIIPADVTLSIGEADVHLDAVDIAGALVNNGNVDAGTIIVSGLLENTGTISFTELIGCETTHIKNGGILAGEIDDQCIIESIARAEGAKNFRLRLDRNYAWEDIFANVQSGDSVYFDSLYDDCWLIVSGDTIIPDDVQISGLCTVHVLEGATLTTIGTAFSPYMMLIDGTWINNGSVDLDILTVNGTVRNNGQITVWEITGDKKVVGNAVVNQSSNSGQYVTILDLQEALDSAERGETIRCNQLAYGNGDSTILNTDIVVPEGITLEFSSVSKVYLTAGHTLTVNGTLLMQQQLYVAGNLVVNGNVTVDAADGEGSYFLNMFDLSLGGIAVTDTGSCSVNGSIRVAKIDYSGQLISDPLSVLRGIDGSAFSARETDRYWYLANSSQSAILCTVQNDDCTLRLLNETDCVWQSASVSDGVLITGVAPGQYTLEVSKPGYVTRCYAVDTGNMMGGLSVQLVRRGNINGACVGGIDVEITDLACLYQYLTEGKNEGSIQDDTYFKAVADVNDDDAINVYDLQRLYEAVSGVRVF